MRLFRVGLRNLRRSLRRTLFTGLSLAVSLFLFVALVSVIHALDDSVERAGSRPLAVVTHKAGFIHALPEHYAEKIRHMPGVREVMCSLYYGGHYGDDAGPQDRFPSIGVDSRPETRAFWGPDFVVSDEAWNSYLADRTSALVGPQLIKRYGWKPGQKITLHGTAWPVDMSFTIAGEAYFRTDQSLFLLHRSYLEEALGRPGLASLIWVQMDNMESMPTISRKIDDLFANSTDPVRTVSHKQFVMTFLGMLGDVRGMVGGLSLLVMIALFFVTANSIALSARERAGELAILKTIGFSNRDIFLGLITESCALALAGGAVGLLAAYWLFHRQAFSLGFGPLSGFRVTPTSLAMGLGATFLVGALASLLPAYEALRRRTADALRRFD